MYAGAGPSRRLPVYTTNPPVVADPLDTGGPAASPSSPGPSPYAGGTGGTASFSGDAAGFLKSLYEARPAFLRQQGNLLESLGPALRQSIFNASPELAQASDYLNQTFSDPFGGARSTFEDAIRGAQSARGFTGGGSGVVGEEARYLTNYAMQRRDALLPQLTGFGNAILGISGLQGPPDITLGAIGALALQNRNQIDSKAAAEAQSRQAAQMYQDFLAGAGGGTAGGVGGAGAGSNIGRLTGAGGSTTSIVGGAGAGQGTPDFFSRESAPYQAPADLAQLRLLYAAGLLGNVDPVLQYGGGGNYGTSGGGPSAVIGGGDTIFSV